MRLPTILKCLLAFVAFASIVVSCSTGSSGNCTKGASVACTCTTGHTGAQICQADGSLGACVCTDATGGGVANGGGVATGGTGGGSAAAGGGTANGGGADFDGGHGDGGSVLDAGPVDAGPSSLGQLCPDFNCPPGDDCIAQGSGNIHPFFCSPECDAGNDTCNTNYPGPGVGVCAVALTPNGSGPFTNCGIVCLGIPGTDGGCPAGSGMLCKVVAGGSIYFCH